MEIIATELPGVLIVRPRVFADDRGWFVEAWSRDRFAVEPGLPGAFVQDNLSCSRPGVLRGLHYQHPNGQGKFIQALRGSIFDVAVDIRRGSPHFGRHVAVHLSADDPSRLYIPPGFAHGFLVVGDAEALVGYKCTTAYRPADEGTVRWDDPALAIPWPLAVPPRLSPRDATAPRLEEIPAERLPAYAPAAGGRPAVFLDRDGTVIEQVDYLADPAQVRLLPGAAEALRRLGMAGFARIVVTNQSGVERGLMTRAQVEAVHEELRRQLAEAGADVEAIHWCPVAPRGEDRTVCEHPDRKPGPGLLLRAAAALGLDLGRSWMVGDLISDVLAGVNAGCRGSILVRSGKGVGPGEADAVPDLLVCDDLAAAVERILADRPSAHMLR